MLEFLDESSSFLLFFIAVGFFSVVFEKGSYTTAQAGLELLCSTGWPQIWGNPHSLAAQVLGLQARATTANSVLFSAWYFHLQTLEFPFSHLQCERLFLLFPYYSVLLLFKGCSLLYRCNDINSWVFCLFVWFVGFFFHATHISVLGM